MGQDGNDIAHGMIGKFRANDRELTGVLVKDITSNDWQVITVDGLVYPVRPYFGCDETGLTVNGVRLTKEVRRTLERLGTVQNTINDNKQQIKKLHTAVTQAAYLRDDLIRRLKMANGFCDDVPKLLTHIECKLREGNNYGVAIMNSASKEKVVICIKECIFIKRCVNPAALPYVTKIDNEYIVEETEMTDSIAQQYQYKSLLRSANWLCDNMCDVFRDVNVTSEGFLYCSYSAVFEFRSKEKLNAFAKQWGIELR